MPLKNKQNQNTNQLDPAAEQENNEQNDKEPELEQEEV